MALFLCGKHLLQRTSTLVHFRNYAGYIVLVPEIGEDLPDKNPLLQQNGLPEFNNISVENCMAAIGKQTLDFEAGIRTIEDHISQQPIQDVFKEVIDPIENLGVSLDTTWGLSKTLYLGNNSLMPTKSYLTIHERARRARCAKFNSTQVYGAIRKHISEGESKSEEHKRVIRKFELEGKLNGLELSVSNKATLDSHLSKLGTERAAFKTKIEYATKLFKHQINDEQIVKGFPAELLQAMSLNKKDYLKAPWFASLQLHIYRPFMEYCPDRNLRWNTWQAMVGRGSMTNKEVATSLHLEEIRFLRRSQANLLGYDTFSDMSMETKMAGSVENIKNMFSVLLSRALPSQQQELENLYKFAVDGGFEGERIQLWDVPYWRRKQLINSYDYNEDEIKKYFPLPKVLNGLFRLCERLFDITIKNRNDVSTWDKEVQYYDIFDGTDTTPVAGFYLDPYVRTDEKLRIPYNNGWMVGIQNRSQLVDTKPLAALIFNFQLPTTKEQSFLTFKEVSLLFHKFGQALQHLLSRTRYSEVSGSSNVEWDAVEICGHVLAHWLYNKTVIKSISSHCDNQNEMPDEVFNSLLSARKHLAGLDLCRELYLSMLDLELHSSKDFWLDIVRNLWPRYRCFPLDKYDSHPCSFTQIFAEEWAAAYYSHVWARVIAADVYSAFYEVQNDEQQLNEVGKRFRNTFLALGGGCDPNEVFRKFRGRDPSAKALLSSLSLKKTNVETSTSPNLIV